MSPTLKRRLLLVDDDLDVLTSLGNVLTAAGYEVIQASEGAEVPIIAIAGGEGALHDSLLEDAKRLGGVATLRKPFNAPALLALVARTLANAHPDES